MFTLKIRAGGRQSLKASPIRAVVQISGAQSTGEAQMRAELGRTPPTATPGRECKRRVPLAAVPQPCPPPPFSDFLTETKFPTGKTNAYAGRRPPAPSPAFKSGRGVSSNLSPLRPRTAPPPPRSKRVTKGRARRVPPRETPRKNPAPGRTTLRATREDGRGGGGGQRREPEERAGGGGALEDSGKRAGGSPWEGPSGPGSAAAAGPGDWPARSASGQRAP